jgi:hypothetical protein
MILQVLIAMIAGWINRHQQHVITYLKEENRVLKSKLPGGRLRLTDIERRRLAALAHPLGRKQLKGLCRKYWSVANSRRVEIVIGSIKRPKRRTGRPH